VSLSPALECLLFVAGEPLPLSEMARALQCDELTVEEALRALQLELGERGSGLQIISIANGYQLSTRSEHAETIARLLARGSNKLSRAALETLAIIAYRQPITQPEIEAVRGVGVAGVVKNLLDKKLVAEAGRKQVVGRPILYATTPEFLHYFAIADLSELPPLAPGEEALPLTHDSTESEAEPEDENQTSPESEPADVTEESETE
jgi:segregation and condensation protein B